MPYQFIISNSFVHLSRDWTPLNAETLPNILQDNYGVVELNFVNDTSREIQLCFPQIFKQPNRLLSYHLGILIPVLFFCCVILFLCVLFRNVQPLKSRGTGPMISTVFYMIPLIAEYILAYQFTYENQSYFSCFIYGYIIYPPTLISTMVIFIHYFRYMIILNMQGSKNKNVKDQIIVLNSLRSKLFQRITHPFTIFLIPTLYLILYYIVISILYGLFKFQCGNLQLLINRGIVAIFAVSISFFVGVLQIWDFLANLNVICKCYLRKHFFINDHFFYRIEFFVTPLYIILIPIWLALPMPGVINDLLTDILVFGEFWVGGFFILWITIIKFIYEKLFFKRLENLSPLNEIFYNERLYDLFLEFSKNEWSMENVYFKKYCLNYKRASKEEERKKLSNEIKTLFLSYTDSIFELNVTKDLIEQTTKKLKEDKYTDDLFDDLDKENINNLNDIYYRFINSFEYKFYIEKLNAIEGKE